MSRPFVLSASGACGGTITATLLVQDGPTNLGTKTFDFSLGVSTTVGQGTFSNPAPITIPSVGPATPYPSDIAVSGLGGTVSKVTVTLTGITHAFPSDIDILLVGPSGQGTVLLSDIGDGIAITDVTITLDDAAGAQVPTPIVDGTYWPAGRYVGDPFPPPAPPQPHGTDLSFLNGIAPNGTWSLYVVDAVSGDAGSISGGWSLTITTAVPVCCQGGTPQLSIDNVSVTEGNAGTTTATFTATLSTISSQTVTVDFATADGTATTANNDYLFTSGALTFAPGIPVETIAVNVNGDLIFEPNEGFFLNLSNPINATVADGQGLGTILNDDGPSGTNFVTELSHGYSEMTDLASTGGVPNVDYYRLAQKPYSSYEVLVDATSGDIGPALDVQRIGPDGTAVVQDSVPVGVSSSRSLRWANTAAAEVTDQYVRVGSAGCTTDCGPDDVYGIHAFETTYSVPRFNNSGTQITVLLLQNPANYAINVTAFFWDSAGALKGTMAFTLTPKQLFVLNTSTVAPGVGGSVTIAHDGRYGDLSGKTVALEPATGFSFDSPMLPRLKMK
jgi:subtilisin-like proprotein convertase family protein